MSVRILKLALILFLLCPPILASSLFSKPAFISDSLDAYILQSMKDWKIPGLAICIVHEGEIVLSKGYGTREWNKDLPVDDQTLFMIGSNTKAFTSTALAMLDYNKKCSLNDPVQKWLPGFSQTDPWIASHTTLEDLLCHRLGYETFQGDFMYWDSDLTPVQVLEKFGKLPPLYSFRNKFGYTNAAFHAAGECIPEICGKNWDEYIRQSILMPLEMNRTQMFARDMEKAENASKAHTLIDGKIQTLPYCRIDHIAAAASMSSTAHDMSHWLLALLSYGQYKDEKIIPAPVILNTRLPRTIIGRNGSNQNTIYRLYGLGWFLQDYKGKEVIFHSGAVDGFLSSVRLIPSEKLGVVILTNTDANEYFDALAWEILDSFLGFPREPYGRADLTRFQTEWQRQDDLIRNWKDSASLKPALPLPAKAFIGKYYHPVYGWTEISYENKQLILRFQHHHSLTAILDYIGNNRFLCTYSNPVFGRKIFPFEIKNQKVLSFTLSVNEFVETTTYLFIKNNEPQN